MQAPAIEQAGVIHCFAHAGAAEYDRLHQQQPRILGEIDVDGSPSRARLNRIVSWGSQASEDIAPSVSVTSMVASGSSVR